MELCWNDSETVESTKEARATCTHTTLDAEALCSATVKEAKATCAHTIWEAETFCSTAIRDAEIQGASQADSLHHTLHQRHAKTIQHLEEQVIQEEGKSQIDFLSACQAALQASLIELRGAMVASYHMLMGQASTSHPFTLSQEASPAKQLSAQAPPPLPVPECPPRPKGNTPPQTHGWHASWWDHIQGNIRRAPQLQMARGPTLVQGTQAEPLRSIQLGHYPSEGG